MSKEYGYIGKEVTQAFRDNKGIFTPQDIIELDQENKWTNFGQLELIETATVSSSTASIEFQDLKDYNVHFLTVADGTVSQDNGGIAFRVYENGTLESSSVYDTARQICGSDGSFSENRSTNNSAFRFADNILLSSVPRGNINGYLYFYDLLDGTKFSMTTQHSTVWSNSNIYRSFFGSQCLPQVSSVNQIQVFCFNSGTLESGTFSLYGIRFA